MAEEAEDKQRQKERRQKFKQRKGAPVREGGERPRNGDEHRPQPEPRERGPEGAGERGEQRGGGQRPRGDAEHIFPSLYVHYSITGRGMQMQFLGMRRPPGACRAAQSADKAHNRKNRSDI